MTQPVDLLITHASQLLTMEDGLGLIEDGAVAVHNGKIVATGKTSDLEKRFVGQEIIDASGKTITPGLVDCHTHLLFAGSREQEFASRLKGADYLSILQQGGGILNTVEQVRQATPADLIQHGLKWLNEFLTHGVTCVEIKSGYGLDYANEKKMLEAISALSEYTDQHLVATFLGAHTFPKEMKEQPEKQMDELVKRMLPDFRELAEHCDLFLEKGAFSLDQAELILECAQSLGYGLKMHTNQLSQLGGIALAKKYQLLSVDHLDIMSAEEIDTLAETDAVAVLLPGASFFLKESAWAPARKLIDKRIPVALATDFNPGSSPCPNLHFVMNLAVHQLGMLPDEVWQAVTVNAARALNKNDTIGSLIPGKYADLVLWDMPNHLHPFYYFGKNFVEKVWVNGRYAHLH